MECNFDKGGEKSKRLVQHTVIVEPHNPRCHESLLLVEARFPLKIFALRLNVAVKHGSGLGISTPES